MHFRLRLLLLVTLVAGAAAAFSGAAAAQPSTARSDDRTIIIRPVQPAPATAPPTVPPTVPPTEEKPAPLLSPQPDVSKEWVVTESGRFQALSEDASPAAVDAAVAEELVAQEPEGGAADGALARHAVDAIFPVAATDAAPQREFSVVADSSGDRTTADDTAAAGMQPAPAAAALKLQAATDREARQRAAKASQGSRSRAATKPKAAAKPQAAGTASKKQKQTATAKTPGRSKDRAATAKKPGRSKDRAAGAKQRRATRAAKASVRRQAQIRTATSRVKRALRATASRRRARIPAPPIIDVPVTKVRDIVVHRRIAGRTAALLAAADRANLRLNGWGYRSTQRQIQLRRQHCGKSRYAMYRMPSGRCWPPTAPPGKSLHERGLAIDFYVEGRKGKALPIAGTREFRWLKRNAARYGFYNLPSEAWHWSVNGR